MATLHLICGLPGSGKSTLGQNLEHDLKALRLAPDDWMARLGISGNDAIKRQAIEAEQRQVATEALAKGTDVILENGFWEKSEREKYRKLAQGLGAKIKLHYLEVPVGELKRRLQTRNQNLPPNTFYVDPDMIDEWVKAFEPPTEDELKGS